MFHVEQKEPGAGNRQGADREPTGSRQGTDREPTGSKRKNSTETKCATRLSPFFRCLRSRPLKNEGELSGCTLRGSETEPGKDGTLYYGSRYQFKAGFSGGDDDGLASIDAPSEGDRAGRFS